MADQIQKLEKKVARLSKAGKETTELVDALNDLAWEIGLKQSKRAFALSEYAQKIARSLDYKRGLAFCYRNFGYGYSMSSDLESGIRYLRKALEAFAELDEPEGESTVLDTMSLSYWRLGNYQDALNYAYEALNLSRKIGFRKGEAWALHNLGSIRADLDETAEAIGFFEESLAIFKEIEHLSGVGRVYSCLGETCKKQGCYDEALQFNQKSLKIIEGEKIPLGAGAARRNIAEIYEALGDDALAESYYQAALSNFRKSYNREFTAGTLEKFARFYLRKHDPEKALPLLQQALKMLENTNARPTTYRVYEALAEAYENLDKPAEALKNFKEFHRFKEQIHNQENVSAMERLQMRLDVEKAEKEAEIHRLRYSELAEMQARLIQSAKSAMLGDLVAGIAHEVNTPIGIVNGNADVLEKALRRLFDSIAAANGSAKHDPENLEKTLAILLSNNQNTIAAGKKIAGIIASLKNFARLDEADRQLTDIHEGLDNTLTLISARLPADINIFKKYGRLPRIYCYPQALNQVFLTLLLNAVESIDGKGSIDVVTDLHEDSAAVIISDTGRGIEPERLSRIFDIGFSSRENKVRMNVGLANSYSIIVDRHAGRISAESEVGKGSSFKINLPLNYSQPAQDID